MGLKWLWLSAAIAVGLIVTATWWRHSYAPIRPFLIYYGGLPRSHTRLQQFEQRLSGYPVVVLGTGLDEQKSAERIIAWGHGRPHPMRFYGYISIGITHNGGDLPVRGVNRRLQEWKAIGADGVLYDTAGPDYGVSQTRLATLVKLAHQLGMTVIVNAWSPSAVLHAGLTKRDGYLAENWYASDGTIRSIPNGAKDIQRVIDVGIPVYMTATGGASVQSLPPAMVKSWIAGTSHVARGTYLSISDEYYSAQTDYTEPASAITAAVHSFFPFGLWRSTKTAWRQLFI